MVGFSDRTAAGRLEAVLTAAGNDAVGCHLYDGVGHAFMNASPAPFATFDAREDWLLQGMQQTPGAFYLLPVALHEIGHCLGLAHGAPAQVMSPYYVANRVALTPADVVAAKAAATPSQDPS